jgi:hypothetical protein
MNLGQLAKGPMTVRFAIPSRLDTYEFRVRRVESPSQSVVRVRVDMDDWLVRLLAPDIEVDYERKTGRLLRYRGVSNLDTVDGDTQKVVIRYSYPDSTGG